MIVFRRWPVTAWGRGSGGVRGEAGRWSSRNGLARVVRSAERSPLPGGCPSISGCPRLLCAASRRPDSAMAPHLLLAWPVKLTHWRGSFPLVAISDSVSPSCSAGWCRMGLREAAPPAQPGCPPPPRKRAGGRRCGGRLGLRLLSSPGCLRCRTSQFTEALFQAWSGLPSHSPGGRQTEQESSFSCWRGQVPDLEQGPFNPLGGYRVHRLNVWF